MATRHRHTALIIDDDSMSRTILRTILAADEYDVVGEANNGKKGIELALELKPEIICLDHVMPEMSGLDVLLELREQLPGTLILMVTGSAERETVQAALQGGADGYVVKPFNSGRVLAALEQARTRPRKPKPAT
jgi:two-component system chemotaxis response regulator CheY